MAVRPDDPKFEETLLRWYDELENEPDSDNGGTDYEDHVSIQSDRESTYSMDESEEESEAEEQVPRKVIKGKNGHIWSTELPCRTRTPKRNIVSCIPGPKGAAKNISTELEAWKLFFSSDVIDIIVLHTNMEIERQREKYVANCGFVNETDVDEILALIGLLYMAGCRKDNHLTTAEMWSKHGPEVYRCVMSETRFRFLISCLRFDEKTVRNREDKFSPIRNIWEIFISNCTKYYTPHSYCTIDEQLLGFRGNCPFRVYISSKPDKYGIKIVTMCDSRTYYMVTAIPYIGKENRPNKEPLPDYYVKKLTEPIHGTGRNLTMDNWFTSIPLADKMLVDYNLTIVGTLRKNKREIPPSFLPNKRKEIMSSQFAFDNQKTLVSFTPKKSKSVLLLSTMHSGSSIEENKKPEIINFYNSTKGGVDTFDQMVHTYSVSRKTRRWPLRFFYGIMDQAGINSNIIFQIVRSNRQKSVRRKYLFELGLQLARPHMERRLTKPVPRTLKESIMNMLDMKSEGTANPPPSKLQKQTRCILCPRTNDRKTKTACAKCFKAVCNNHRAEICTECLK